MTIAQVVETSLTVNNSSPFHDYVHPDEQTQPTFEMTPGFKPFTVTTSLVYMLKHINEKNNITFVGCIFPKRSQRKKYCTSARKTLTGKSVYLKGQKVSKQVQLN